MLDYGKISLIIFNFTKSKLSDSGEPFLRNVLKVIKDFVMHCVETYLYILNNWNGGWSVISVPTENHKMT